MKKLLLIGTILLWGAIAFSQNSDPKPTVTVTGFVSLGSTPLVNFKVVMAVYGQEGFQTTYTDSAGQYTFSDTSLQPGEDTVKIFASGRHTFYGTIMISWPVVINDLTENRDISIAHNVPDFTCGSAFGFNFITANKVQFINMSFDTETTQYNWDFDDGFYSNEKHPIHTYNGNGNFDVGLGIQHDGCSDFSEEVVKIERPSKYYGHVIYEGSHDLDFILRLIPKNNPKGEWYVGVTDVYGNYSFIDVPTDEYIIEAIPKDMYQYIYPKPIITYYPNNLYWNNADTANFYSESNIVIQTSNFVHSGGNQILCQFNDPDNLLEYNPSIVLFNANNEPLTTAIEDMNTYSFSDLQEGTYLVYPHYPGKTTIPYEVTFNEYIGLTETAIFDVTETHVAPPGMNISENTIGIEVYPNPATSSLFISSNNSIKHIKISNLHGQTIYEINHIGVQFYNLDIKSLSKGMYFLTIYSIEGVQSQKIVVE